jgi:hypothetical protein
MTKTLNYTLFYLVLSSIEHYGFVLLDYMIYFQTFVEV